MLPGKKLEIWGSQTAGNALKLSILPPPRYFCIILNLLRSYQGGPFWLLSDCVRTPRTPPLPTGLHLHLIFQTLVKLGIAVVGNIYFIHQCPSINPAVTGYQFSGIAWFGTFLLLLYWKIWTLLKLKTTDFLILIVPMLECKILFPAFLKRWWK